MKKTLLSISFVMIFAFSQGQNLLVENFENYASLATAGWTQTNQSNPLGTINWGQGTAGTTANPNPIPPAYNGTNLSFAQVNFNSTTGAGDISNWLITPVVSLQNGDVISFYTRTVPPVANPSPTNTFPDRLELRISTNGATSALPSGSTGLGDYTTLALSVNPNLLLTGYPGSWTQFSYTVTGLSSATNCKIAFRYFVTNGGPSGANSNLIGLDAVSVDRTLGTKDFFNSNFTVFPNPSNDVVNISNTNNLEITDATITDINGRVVKQVNSSVEAISISELNAGVYFLKINTLDGSGTTKIVKN